MARVTRRGNLEARELFQRALAIDPDYAPALASLAANFLLEWTWCWGFDENHRERAIDLLHRALDVDPTGGAHYGLGLVELTRNRPAEAIPHLERAIELRPSHVDARIALSAAQSSSGEPLIGLRTLQGALRLAPRRPPVSLTVLALAQQQIGRLDDSIRTAESVRKTYPDQLPTLLTLAFRYESMGRHEEAREIVAEVLEVNPNLRGDQLAQCLRHLSQAELAVATENLRRAGLP